MNRRNFIKRTAAASTLPLLLGGFDIGVMGMNASLEAACAAATDTDRVLVLIQLNGGNDGLNTLIPIDQYSTLSAARSNVLIPQNNVLNLTTNTGLHPAMAGIHNLYNDGKASFVQSVGYPDPNFSHFRSQDIWTTGSPADEVYTTGWLGRYLDSFHPDYPEGYPSTSFPDPLAITIGSTVSNTCQGMTSSLGMAIKDPNEFIQLTTGSGSSVPNTPYGYELNFLRQTILQTNQYIQTIQSASTLGNNLSTMYPNSGNSLSDQLKIVAQLISGGLKTPIYIVNLGGFDTHAEQVDVNDVLVGSHTNLLGKLSTAVAAFQNDLQLLGVEDRVLSMTFSEFGRRIRSNDSYGTDHGSAAPLMLFGPEVSGQIHGTNPIIPSDVDDKASVPMQFDFRSVYGSILMDWFCVEQSHVEYLLYSGFQRLPILQSTCEAYVSDLDDPIQQTIKLINYPNPFSGSTRISFESLGGPLSIRIFDTRGSVIRTLTEQNYAPGEYEITFDASGLSAGIYYCRLQQGNETSMVAMSLR